MSASKKYGFVPLESVQGVFQVVPNDWHFPIAELYKNQNRVKRMCCDKQTNREVEQFNVSRFYSSGSHEYQKHEISASS